VTLEPGHDQIGRGDAENLALLELGKEGHAKSLAALSQVHVGRP
jgi:hypothetical protein